MPIPSSITDLQATESLNSPQGGDQVGGNIDNFFRAYASIIKRQFAKGADINSAATMSVPADGSVFNVVKVISAIAGFTDNFNGRIVHLKFEAGITLTHSASLIMPVGVSVVTQADDVVTFVNESAGVWRCIDYPRYVASDYAGAEPTITWPYMTWADTGTMLLKRRNAANTAWVTIGPLLTEMAVKTGVNTQTFKAAPSTAADEVTVQSQVFGVGQSRQDKTAVRAPDVVYTNSENKPIEVTIHITTSTTNGSISLFIGALFADFSGFPTVAVTNQVVRAIVLPGETYKATLTSGATIFKWLEIL